MATPLRARFRGRRGALTFAVALAGLAVAAPAQATTTVTRTTYDNGDLGIAQWSTSGPFGIPIDVLNVVTIDDPTALGEPTLLQAVEVHYVYDAFWNQIAQSSRQIYTTSGFTYTRNGTHEHVFAASIPAQSCSFDFVAGTGGCTPLTGSIDITWTASGAVTTTGFTEKDNEPPTYTLLQATGRIQKASTTGTLFGQSIAPPPGVTPNNLLSTNTFTVLTRTTTTP